MVDSMPWHAQGWVEFARRHGLTIDVPRLHAPHHRPHRLRVHACELFGPRDHRRPRAPTIAHQKEVDLPRALRRRRSREVAGFRAFARQRGRARPEDRRRHRRRQAQHRLRDVAPARWTRRRSPSSAATKACPASPSRRSFSKPRAASAWRPRDCIVFEDAPFGIEAARRGGMRAVAVCTTHSAAELAGPHVIAAVRDYNELMPTRTSWRHSMLLRDAQGQPIAIRREDYTRARLLDRHRRPDLRPRPGQDARAQPHAPAPQPRRAGRSRCACDGDELNLARVLVDGQGASFRMEDGQLVHRQPARGALRARDPHHLRAGEEHQADGPVRQRATPSSRSARPRASAASPTSSTGPT